MLRPDLGTHTWSIALLTFMTLTLLVVVILLHTYIPADDQLRALMAATFSGFAGALLLALRGNSIEPPKPPPPPPPPTEST